MSSGSAKSQASPRPDSRNAYSAKEVGLIIKEEFSELELRAQVYADGLSVGQELLYKYLAVEGQGNWCETKKSD